MFTDTRLRRLWSILASDVADGLCLDVFDTLLLRTVPEPSGVFTLLGDRLRQAGRLPAGMTADVFAKLRLAAEVRARRESLLYRDTAETRLLEIYEQVVIALPYAGTPDELAAAEVELERDCCRADLGVVDLIGAVAQLGKPVYLLSDTYLSAAQLGRVLERPELVGRSIKAIYTSSDAATSKGSALAANPNEDGERKPVASLFDILLDDIAIPAARLVHLGDHPIADVRGARQAGLQTVHYPKLTRQLAQILDREGTIPVRLTAEDGFDSRQGDFGLTAVRARVLARSEAEQVPTELNRYWDTGATVFGPALAGFAEWVVGRAQALGVDRISCLQREGDFLAELIREHATEVGIEVNTLWVSRQVCALAAVYEGSAKEFQAFLSRRRAPTVGQLIEQLGVPAGEVPALSGILEFRLDSPSVSEKVLRAITNDSTVHASIVIRAARQRERLLRHLDEQLPSSGRAVVVDLGWGGTIQTLLARILRVAGRPLHLVGLYLATNATSIDRRLDGVEMEGYLASHGNPERLFAPLMRGPEMLEQLCMPDYGSLVGFDESLTPQLSTLRMSRTQEAQKAAAQAGVKAFSREWRRYRGSENPLPSLDSEAARAQLLRTVSRFLSRPTMEEALAFSSWSHDDNFGSEAVEGLVSDEMMRCLPYLTPVDLGKLSMREVYWPTGVATVVNPTLARIAALSLETGAELVDLSPLSDAGVVEVYVDQGSDFADGPKETVPARAASDGLSLVRASLPVRSIRKIRLDPDGRRGLLRVDWLRLSFHLADERDLVVVEVRDLAADPQVRVSGARLIQANLLEITSADPQIVYTLDSHEQAALTEDAFAVDVELAFAYLAVGAESLQVLQTEPPVISLMRRFARRVFQELADRL